MKNLFKIGILIAALSACSNDKVPNPHTLGHDIQTLPPYTGIAVLPNETLSSPKNNTQIIEKQTTFRVLDNVYSENGNRVIVHRGAIISGVYSNNGTECKITWKSIYANKKEYKAKRGTFWLGYIAQPFLCDPTKGIKVNQRVMIRVNSEFLD